MKRFATHAGSWYTNSKQRLHQQLDGFLNAVPAQTSDGDSFPIPGTRAIIAPHAGYSYSGPTAAYAYKCVDVTNITRVFILGPSHHVYLESCALSECDSYETPLGDLMLDKQVIRELAETGLFSRMSKTVDEDEHSIEMHLPYTAKIFEGKLDEIKIVPIMVGSISEEKERRYGQVLAKYLADPQTLFIVSSDFCHWGARFSYTEYRSEPRGSLTSLRSSRSSIPGDKLAIHQSISDLDHEGMEKIETLDHRAFCQYLRKTNNTICGRHPVGVLMGALSALNDKDRRIRFIQYAQSNACEDVHDSSVSYASAYTYIAM